MLIRYFELEEANRERPPAHMVPSEKSLPGKMLGALPEVSLVSRRKRTRLRRVTNRVLARLAAVISKLWFALGETVVLYEGDTELDSTKPYVLAGWHEQLLIATRFLSREVRANRSLVALISPSVDGDVAARVALLRGCNVIRPSATRSGAGALRLLISAVRRDRSTAYLVTDGPKGPARKSKPGAVMLARVAGVPLVPLVCVAGSEWRLKSWDRLRIPSPFARKVLVVGKPRPIPRQLDEAGIEQEVLELDRNLERMTAKAESLARAPKSRSEST